MQGCLWASVASREAGDFPTLCCCAAAVPITGVEGTGGVAKERCYRHVDRHGAVQQQNRRILCCGPGHQNS